jgi:hypothetical protein
MAMVGLVGCTGPQAMIRYSGRNHPMVIAYDM